MNKILTTLSMTVLSASAMAISASTLGKLVGKYELVKQSGMAYLEQTVCSPSIQIIQDKNEDGSPSSKNLQVIGLTQNSNYTLTGSYDGVLSNIDGKLKDSARESRGFGEDDFIPVVSSSSGNTITLTQTSVPCSLGKFGVLFMHQSCEDISEGWIQRVIELSGNKLTIQPLVLSANKSFECEYLKQ